MLTTADGLRELIRARALGHKGGQSGLAAELRVSKQYLCDVLAGRREPGPTFLRAYGARRIILYQIGKTTSRREAELTKAALLGPYRAL